MSFNNMWRKRLACERCRQLKVRCEFRGPTSDTCVRCEKSGAKCVIPHKSKRDGDSEENSPGASNGFFNHEGQPKEQVASYLRGIILEAHEKLDELELSPLQQAIASGLYTVAEAESYYAELWEQKCTFSVVTNLQLSASVMEVDKKWPGIAIALVSIKALNTTQKPMKAVESFICGLFYEQFETQDCMAAVDRQVGAALICQFVMKYRDNATGSLVIFHNITDFTLELLSRARKPDLADLVLHTAIITILPYTFIPKFESLTYLVRYYHTKLCGPQTNCRIYDSSIQSQCARLDTIKPSSLCAGIGAIPIMKLTFIYHKSCRDFETAQSFDELSRKLSAAYETASNLRHEVINLHDEYAKRNVKQYGLLATIPVIENIRIIPFVSTYLWAKCNLLHKAMLRMFILLPENTDLPSGIVQDIIALTVNSTGELFRSLAHVDLNKTVIPKSMLCNIPMALVNLQAIRFVSFASGTNVNVHHDCLLKVVVIKWDELMQKSIFIRTHYLLLFRPQGLANVKIGQLDPATNQTEGKGSMDPFHIIHYDEYSHNIRGTFPMSREALRELLRTIVIRNANRDEENSRLLPMSAVSFQACLSMIFKRQVCPAYL